MFAPLLITNCHVCLPSWSAMHDECVTCAKKCAIAMGANVLKSECNLNNMTGDGEDGRIYVLLLLITVFMQLALIQQRS